MYLDSVLSGRCQHLAEALMMVAVVSEMLVSVYRVSQKNYAVNRLESKYIQNFVGEVEVYKEL